MTAKAKLRKEIAEQRRSLDTRWLTDASLRIAAQIQRLDTFINAKRIALYKAIAGEADLESLFAACWDQDKHTAIPVFDPTLEAYTLAEITAQTEYITGKYGIQEPEKPMLVPVAEMDLIILPGVAFDAAGNRLGRGGGYYDRLLAGFNGTTVAVAFEFQLIKHIPHEAHDIPVRYIVTESKIVDVCNER